MTAYRYWTLTCDSCGAVSESGLATTTYEAIVAARREGWTRYKEGRYDRDRCGVCNGTHDRDGYAVAARGSSDAAN